jgi:hypothetical protein
MRYGILVGASVLGIVKRHPATHGQFVRSDACGRKAGRVVNLWTKA